MKAFVFPPPNADFFSLIYYLKSTETIKLEPIKQSKIPVLLIYICQKTLFIVFNI